MKFEIPTWRVRPSPLHPGERADRIGERNARVRPVDQQEVDVGEAQLRQAFLGGPLEFARRQVVLPDLGGDEDVVAPDPAGAQTLPDLALIAIHLGGVDVAVSEPPRLLDPPGAEPTAQIPGAETDHRDARAVTSTMGVVIAYRYKLFICDYG